MISSGNNNKKIKVVESDIPITKGDLYIKKDIQILQGQLMFLINGFPITSNVDEYTYILNINVGENINKKIQL